MKPNEQISQEIKPLKKSKKLVLTKPKDVDYALYPQSLSNFDKFKELFWFIPNKIILKKIEVRKQKVLMEMWNGKLYKFDANDFESKYELDQNYLRILHINILGSKEKIRIKEVNSMYPNGSADFDDLITLFGAEKSSFTKVVELVLETSKVLKPILKGIL